MLRTNWHDARGLDASYRFPFPVDPFYFGSDARLLYGVYHPPVRTLERDKGVVLCYPMGQEYMRAHRSYVVLAQDLAHRGHHVLRFDYTGCGDSAGESTDGTLVAWLDDLRTAVGELRSIAALEEIHLIGLRLGGTIAALLAAKEQIADGLVLWDPVVSGKAHCEELVTSHRQWLQTTVAQQTHSSRHSYQEILGFSMSDELTRSITDIDLMSISSPLPWRLLMLETTPEGRLKDLSDRWRTADNRIDYSQIISPPVWLKQQSDLDHPIVPTKALLTIGHWLGGVDH